MALWGWRIKLLTVMVVAIAATVVILVVRGAGRKTACAACPNVIVFETDDQTVAELQVLPRVRKLIGSEGVTFDNSFVNFSDCCPSRATFLTGQYAHNHGVLSNAPPDGGFPKLDSDETLPVWLQRAGYHTIFVGKYLNWYGHSDRKEVPPGWDEWNAAVDTFIGKMDVAAFYRTLYNRDGHLERLPPSLYRTDADAETARAAIRRVRHRSQPFFMWLTFLSPHGGLPREPDDPSGGQSPRGLNCRTSNCSRTPARAARHRGLLRDLRLPRPPNFNEADVTDKPPKNQFPRLTVGQIAGLRQLFIQRRESLLAVDEAVASIISTLRQTGKLSKTLIIFTSDNGNMFGEHRIPAAQQWIYEPAIRVPLLMSGPGIPRNQHRRQLVINADLAPTIVDAAHADAGVTMDGLSLLPLARSPLRSYARDLLLEVSQHFGRKAYYAVRTPRYVFAQYLHGGDKELYDLRLDPWELTNRWGDPRYATIQTRLQRTLDRLRDCRGASCHVQAR